MIVHSGGDIVVHHHEGASDYLLVTFCGMYHEHEVDRHYFLRSAVEAADLSCIGVITPVRRFYLSPDMSRVVQLVEENRQNRKVVVIGQSMGGYAAIKYSAALKADHVLAFAPYYSVDPDELELPTDNHRKILMHAMAQHGLEPRPEFKGMAITPAECSGRIIVFYDPSEFIDEFDAGLLRRHLPRIEFVTVPNAGHIIHNTSWRPAMVPDLIHAARSPDHAAVRREMLRIRRSNAQFILRALHRAVQRKPGLCLAALHSARVVRNAEYAGILADPVNTVLIHALFASGRRAAALGHLVLVARKVMQLSFGPLEVADGPLIDTMLEQTNCLLLSVHGTFLAYDVASRSVRFEHQVFKRTDLVPVFARRAGGACSFHVLSGSLQIPVRLDGAAPGAAPELAEAGAHCVAIRRGNSYLGANWSGGVQWSAVPGEAERLVPLPVPEQSGVMSASSLTWFDRVALTQPPPSLPRSPGAGHDMSAVRMRRGPRWRKLFARS